jgi:hypothetical protein
MPASAYHVGYPDSEGLLGNDHLHLAQRAEAGRQSLFEPIGQPVDSTLVEEQRTRLHDENPFNRFDLVSYWTSSSHARLS